MKELTNSRRTFLKNASLTAVGAPAAGLILGGFPEHTFSQRAGFRPASLTSIAINPTVLQSFVTTTQTLVNARNSGTLTPSMWGQTSLALSQLQTEMSNTGAIEQINSSISGQSVQIEGANLENDEGTVISLSQQLAPGINSSFLGSVWGNWNTPTGTQAKQTAIQDGMNSSFNQLIAATRHFRRGLKPPTIHGC